MSRISLVDDASRQHEHEREREEGEETASQYLYHNIVVWAEQTKYVKCADGRHIFLESMSHG